jgi:hypothetical protein
MAILLILTLVTPPLYSFAIFGLYGQIKVTDYPREWYEINDYLNQDGEDFNVLFLPWHEFMDYSWIPNRDKRLGNPARAFFNKPVIQGDNIEMPGIYSQSTNPISRYVEFLLSKGNNVRNLGELIAPLNVKYIILAKEADYEIYNYLLQQDDLSVVQQKPGVTLLRNNYSRSRIYQVKNIVNIKNLDEYLALSKTQNVMENLYVFSNGDGTPQQISGNPGVRPVNYDSKTPVNYLVREAESGYIIFTVPQHFCTDSWEYQEEKSLENLGFMPAYVLNSGDGEIVYTRFYRIYLPAYIISLLAFVLIAGYLSKITLGNH